jgi:chromosome partitioning protein
VNLARELMGQRPLDIEPAVPLEKLSRPAELAQRAKQLAQLTNVQFGRHTVAMQSNASTAVAEAPVAMNKEARFVDTERDERVPQIPARKTTAEKIDEFYGVKQMGSEVLFSAKFPQAGSVSVAGDFNSWSTSTTPLAEGNRPGDWSGRMILPAGRYRYRLVVDGKWMTDPHNTYVETNQFGELNNVIEVD